MMSHLWRLCVAPLLLFLATIGMASAAQTDRLINISSRTQVGTGADVMIAGFIIGPGSPKTVLIRAIGPTLTNYQVTGVLANPRLTLHDASGATLVTNDDWAPADAATMSAAGAFALPTGSHDSVLVKTLNPGAYTAIVDGVNNTTGIALVEVYEVDGPSRLTNISTRARVGTDANILISGLIVASSGGKRRILLRAMGPALKNFGVADPLLDPVLTVYDSARVAFASNDNWESTDAQGISTAVAQAGAVAFAAGSKDSAIVIDLAPGGYTVQIAGVNNTTGVALLEAYDITSGVNNIGPVLNITASIASTSPSSGWGEFTFTRTGDLSSPLTVNFALSGTAQAGADFISIGNSVTFPAGADTVKAFISALGNATSGSKTVIATLAPTAGYQLGSSSAQVSIYYGAGALFLANLHASSGAGSSSGYGSSSLQLTPDENFVYVNLTYSNLTSPETSVYLRYSNAGEDGAYLVRLTDGQPSFAQWKIVDSGGLTAAQIVAGIKSGKVYLSIGTTSFPSGELQGTFLTSSGSQAFTPPAAPPALPGGTPTQTDAARLLSQATFGVKRADIDTVVARGLAGWITDQIALPATLQRDATNADFAAFNTDAKVTKPNGTNRLSAWWKIAVTAPDQLRQRVAFALSEIFVISDVNGNVDNWQEGAANYYDILAKDGLGNFRTLLEDVTLSPMMGVYLSSIKNSKATATTEPDENYAREVMQLFTVGLNQLQPDGTLKLDSSGLPIPTYDQRTVSETAKVFTGWQFNNAAPAKNNFRSGGGSVNDYIQPMTLNPNFHEDATKTVIGGLQIPAGQGGLADLKSELDALFNHPNTGPLFSRQMIERLVTSNPSPGYVYRVAQVFANNGSGVRGDLTAVIRAILLDPEARSPSTAGNLNFGKLKEPLLRVTSLLRAFNGASGNGRFNLGDTSSSLGQAPLRSQTVFNFFEPDYVVSGSLASAGLVAPEYQILTDTTAISTANALYNLIYATQSATAIGLDFSSLPATAQPAAIADYLNLVFAANSMSPAIHDRIVSALTAMPASTTDLEKDRSAVYLALTSQSSAVQK